MFNLHLESQLTACAKTRTPYFGLKMRKHFWKQIISSKCSVLCTRSQLEGNFLRGDLSAVSVARLLPKWEILEDLSFGNKELELVPGTSLFEQDIQCATSFRD